MWLKFRVLHALACRPRRLTQTLRRSTAGAAPAVAAAARRLPSALALVAAERSRVLPCSLHLACTAGAEAATIGAKHEGHRRRPSCRSRSAPSSSPVTTAGACVRAPSVLSLPCSLHLSLLSMCRMEGDSDSALHLYSRRRRTPALLASSAPPRPLSPSALSPTLFSAFPLPLCFAPLPSVPRWGPLRRRPGMPSESGALHRFCSVRSLFLLPSLSPHSFLSLLG